MHPTRWQTAILAALRERGRAGIGDLARLLGVSDETVRRHLRALVEEGVVERTHGAVALAAGASEPPFSRRLHERAEAKRAIGRLAALQIRDGETVLIDAGSTTAYVAEALLARRGLTVVTTSLQIAATLLGRCDHRIYLAGGELRADIGGAVGPEAFAMIREFRADVAVLSIGAVNATDGLMDFDLEETRIARAMIEAARSCIVVADARKLGARARVRVCGLDRVGTLVTDAPPPAELDRGLAAAGTALLIATPVLLEALR